MANAAALARELANTPPTYLNANDIADRAVAIGAESGLTVEVFNKDQLAAARLWGHARREPRDRSNRRGWSS